MDPQTGRIYDLEKDDIPDHVRERLVPIPVDHAAAMKNTIEELQGVSPTQEIVDEAQEFDVQKEAQELGEILEEMDRVINMPGPQPEKFYPINRAARRKSEKRDRATKKRKPNG